MHRTTRIADRDVPIEPGILITVRFSAGDSGVDEAGAWEFWAVYNGKTFIARCRQDSDPGERFRRMEGIKGYESAWKAAAAAKAIRPAKQSEVIKWLEGHPEDARFAVSCLVGPRGMTVVRTGKSFRFADLTITEAGIGIIPD